MAGGEPRLGTTATYMRHNDHGTTRLSTEIDRLHDRTDNEYRIFSAGSVRKWSKFGLDRPLLVPPPTAPPCRRPIPCRSLPAVDHDRPEAQGDSATAPRTRHKARRRE